MSSRTDLLVMVLDKKLSDLIERGSIFLSWGVSKGIKCWWWCLIGLVVSSVGDMHLHSFQVHVPRPGPKLLIKRGYTVHEFLVQTQFIRLIDAAGEAKSAIVLRELCHLCWPHVSLPD